MAASIAALSNRQGGCRAPRTGPISVGMSAFFLPKTHIDLLVSAAVEWKLWAGLPGASPPNCVAIAPEHADVVGRMLWTENAASVRRRYDLSESGEEAVAYAELVAGYRWTRWFGIDPAAVVGFVRCYDYQSCEHDGWRSSDARDFTTRLIAEAAERLAKAALGDAYPWLASDPVRNDSEAVARRWATKAGA